MILLEGTMNNAFRKNEVCVIGQPSCNYVFSASRSCFVAYGYSSSSLEKTILISELEKMGIECSEAGGSFAPAQNAFCSKICSRIIASRFCIVLINNDIIDGREIPNANVNMEYGLMLGFNKYIIPMQRQNQRLPFNVSGLDTIKYDDRSFPQLISSAIEKAIRETEPGRLNTVDTSQEISDFLLSKRMLYCPLNNEGEKNLFQLGAPLGFHLLNDFCGMNAIYFGNFTAFRPENIVWRLLMLCEILTERFSKLEFKLAHGVITKQQKELAEQLVKQTQIWILANTEVEKVRVGDILNQHDLPYEFVIYSRDDVASELKKIET